MARHQSFGSEFKRQQRISRRSSGSAICASQRSLSVIYLDVSEMWSKGKILRRLSLRWWVLAIIILRTSVWWTSAETLAQYAAPASKMTAHSTLWSLEGLGSNMAPHLVIGIADRSDTPTLYGSFRSAGDEETKPSSGNTITRQGGPAASANRTEKIELGLLALSSLLDPTVGVSDLTEPTSLLQTIQQPPDLAGAKVYTLLDDRSALGSFSYGFQANYLHSKQRLAHNEYFTHDVVQAPRPLFELEFGRWRLPVMLSGTAVSR